MSIIARLLPREEKFFRFLENLSTEAHSSATHLKTLIDSKDPGVRKKAAEAILASRTKSKTIAGEVTRELCLTFITPFDREDIQELSSDLYKIPKTIEKIMERLDLHGLTGEKGDFSKQIDLIIQEAESMDAMVTGLIKGGSAKLILDKVALMQELENKGDAVLNELHKSLFKDVTDMRELIARKDVYDMLERVIDYYRDAAGVAMQIVLKHS